MLRSLRIENFALIDEANISFESGFTVITGETGSGKSILLNALNLILGERANFGVIGKLKDKSVVEGLVDLSGFDVRPFFEEHQLDYFDQTILRREIYEQGRSRAFINDVPVQLNVLKDLSSRLIHIHSQYNTLELKDLSYQLEVLDILAGTKSTRREYEAKYRDYHENRKKLDSLEERLSALLTSSDYNQFQLQELELLELDSINYDSLKEQLQTIEQSEDLIQLFSLLSQVLESDNGIIDQLNRLHTLFVNTRVSNRTVDDLKARLQSLILETKDLSETSINELEQVERDPERLKELNERLDEFNKVIYKHRFSTQEELMEYRDSLSKEAMNTSDLEESIEELKSILTKEETELKVIAANLHHKRLQAIPDIEKTIEEALEGLKLKDTRLVFSLSETSELQANGISKVEMLFSPNAGIAPVPIHQAASGGELSRLMLTLQNLISGKMKLQTILFDEIDTGVSGDVAQKIGQTLRSMGENMQVIAITHLPQVAAKGTQHLRVDKFILDGQTKSKVYEMGMDERVAEIARLMSGDEITEAAIQNAKALMS